MNKNSYFGHNATNSDDLSKTGAAKLFRNIGNITYDTDKLLFSAGKAPGCTA